ncbi:MAG TPA: ATP-binding protein [Gemmatimonadaceae bacterium]|nr:ATP-binding protein [Gemmatimonadaceae bacterium]
MTRERTRRVTVTGSESTGKTWLAERLATRFRTVWSREFSREYALHKAAPLDASDVEPIARGQMRAEDEVLRRASGLAIHDTDLVSTVVYAVHYYGGCPPWVEEAARERLADLYLLCDIDLPWVADPARDRPYARRELQAAFTTQLERFGAVYTVVRGIWEEREAAAVAAIGERGMRTEE